MKSSSRIVPLLLLAVAFIVGCDRQNPTESATSSGSVAIAPRLLATSPLPGRRVRVTLLHGTDSTVKDTLYGSRQKLSLGSVPTGDSFVVKIRGYDSTAGGYRQILWTGMVRSKAVPGEGSTMSLDIKPDTAAIPVPVVFDTNPSVLQIPKGCWYTTDSSDPRAKEASGSVHVSNNDKVVKLGTIKITSKVASPSIPGDTLWSQIRTLKFDTAKSRKSLVKNFWWEDDTTSKGRQIFRDSLFNDNSFAQYSYDTTNLDSVVGTTRRGTWWTNDTILRMAFSDGVTRSMSMSIAKDSNEFTLKIDSTMKGRLSRSQPVASKKKAVQSGLRDSLVAVWWEDDTAPSGRRAIHLDSLKSDGSYTRITLDTIRLAPFPTSFEKDTGRWDLAHDTLNLRSNPNSLLAAIVAHEGDHFHLDFGNGGYKARLTAQQPNPSRASNPVKFSLAGDWWVTWKDNQNNTFYYKYAIGSDKSLKWVEYDSGFKTVGNSNGSGTWSVRDSITFVYTANGTNDTADMSSTPDSGFRVVYGSGTSEVYKKAALPTPTKTFLNAFWEDDTTTKDKIRQIFLDSIFSDNTFKRQVYDSMLATTGKIDTGNWRAENGSSVLDLITKPGDTIRLDTAKWTVAGSGLAGRFNRSKPGASNPLVGWWWEDYYYNNTRTIYCDTLYPTGFYASVMYDVDSLKPTGKPSYGAWTYDSVITYTPEYGAPSVGTLSAIAGGYKVVYKDGATSTMSRNPPTVQSKTTDTAWSSTARGNLAGTWWFDTLLVTDQGDTVPAAVRYALSSDGSGRQTVFATWLDSLSDDSVSWNAKDTLIKVVKGDSEMVSKYTKSGDTLHFQDGSNRVWTKTRPILCDPALVGTWVTQSPGDSLILGANSQADWWWSPSNSIYQNSGTWTWSSRAGKVFFWDFSQQTIQYRGSYNPGSQTADFAGNTYAKQ